ncbi:polysaccharide biosynthesis tyrosine autokinase [Stenotrophomonas sp. YIM B06876]|uniref:polysaccharide biosynthesis tyrosine autokinase n=1 Tax=Stenotrophomonas sp. YIM B06876 TaxID=3060211 RepID=UPI00273A13B5|nr:polysaccharide biosynthesis tyrosine autokinase [Stenotrophomonas sp. YIM B06876]
MTKTSSQDGDEIDLRELLGVLIDRKWLIITVTAVFMLGGIAYALLSAPVFQAQAIVQVESKMPSIPGLAELSSLGLGEGSSQATTEVALITSRTVVGEAVDQLKLDIDVQPYRLPLLGDFIARRFSPGTDNEVASPWLGMNSYGWGGETLDIFRLTVPNAMLGKEMMLRAGDKPGSYVLYDDDGRQVLAGTVGETAEGRGVLIEVVGLNANPGTRFHVAKLRPLTVINALQKEIKVSEQGKESGILSLSYENTDAAFAQTFLQKIAEAYVMQNVERNSAQASSQLRFVKEQLPDVRKQVEKAQAAMNAYQTQVNSVDLGMQTQGLLQQEVAVETSIQQLRMQQAEMDRSFTREHPAYRALLKQIGELESRKAGFKDQVSALPDTQQQLLRLTRDLQVSNELYTALLNQAQQLDVARAGTVGNVRIVDAAAVDELEPVKPKKPLIVLVATLLGGFLSVGYVFLQRMLNPGIEDPALIEELGLPVYASIPLSEMAQKAATQKPGRNGSSRASRLLAISEPADLAVEAIRSLRTSLHFAMLEAQNNILMISGPAPGVGKTFVSSNLAAVIAQSGQRVLLIDVDMRKGSLHKATGVAAKGGLSDILGGGLSAEAAIRTLDGQPGFHYITRGDAPPNPSELLMHPRFGHLLETLAPQYDLVIVDTPPILAVTDAAIVARYTGANLLVTRFGLNQPKEVALAKKRFEQNGIVIKGAIFNAVERRSTGLYSYGYYEYKSEAQGA